ncbi:hypothetical protein GCM10025760_34330 [Microbacterium yannicii]|uniref:Uncharacterized protein n=1 Tax=Microbacterium yannicii TaxID=671622 RepID=A0ABP9MQH2_9MICO|nr:hypothetical protein [Microbacterium yannicii]MCO5951897.1 hypothetical protein [Microbacterium yannicii]
MPDHRLAYATGPDTDAADAATLGEGDRRAHNARRAAPAAALDGAARAWTRDPRNRRAEPDADSVRVSLARSAVTPEALAVGCRTHAAEPGAYCWADPRAVCGSRLTLARMARAEAPDPDAMPAHVWRGPRRR